MWLGLLTFSKNKPVLAKDMDLKALIKDAYSRGRMIAVLPFVEKVLAGCKDTKVGGMRGDVSRVILRKSSQHNRATLIHKGQTLRRQAGKVVVVLIIAAAGVEVVQYMAVAVQEKAPAQDLGATKPANRQCNQTALQTGASKRPTDVLCLPRQCVKLICKNSLY
jgi:hypothetical protein